MMIGRSLAIRAPNLQKFIMQDTSKLKSSLECRKPKVFNRVSSAIAQRTASKSEIAKS